MLLRKLFLFVCLLGFCTIVAAQEPAQLSFSRNRINIGSFPISAGSPEFVFQYKNIGESPLIISRLSPGCPCVVPEYSTDPVAPGDSATFKVRYNPPHTGPFDQMITVFSNGVDPVLRIYIKGNVTEPEEKKSENQ